MIGMLVIVGAFVVGLGAFAVLGRHVRNPADLEVSLADHLGILRNDTMAVQKLIGEALLPALMELGRAAQEAVAAFDEMVRVQ